MNINEEFEDIIVETTASSDEDDFIDDSPQESTESVVKEEIEEIITTEQPEIKTEESTESVVKEEIEEIITTEQPEIKAEESTEPIEHSTQVFIENKRKHSITEKTVKKSTSLKKSRLQPKKKKTKKTNYEDEVVILPSLEVLPFDKHYRLVFFTTVELFNKILSIVK